MESVTNSEVRSDGGQYRIKLGVTFEDLETPEYEHAVMWGFEPTLAVDSQNPRLDLNYIIHKKYWEELDVEPTKFSEDDGSEMIHSYGYFDSPYDPECVPDSVRNKMSELFGDELVKGTFSNPPESADVVDVPEIPSEHSVELFTIDINVDGSYSEELEEDDPRVGNGHFTSHVKDSDGEIVHTSYRISHNMSWWVRPTEKGTLVVEKCFHKTWDDRMTANFKENHPGETLVESYQNESETPDLDSLPDEILATLMSWFGEELIKNSLSSRNLPKYVYECFECGEPSHVTPRDHCPACGSDSLCRYESLEQYRERVENRDDDEEKLLDWLTSAEISVSQETPN